MRREQVIFSAISFLALCVLVLGVFAYRNTLAIGKNAKSGAAARQLQCVRLPITEKLYRDLRARGKITAGDLRLIRATDPTDCPPPPQIARRRSVPKT